MRQYQPNRVSVLAKPQLTDRLMLSVPGIVTSIPHTSLGKECLQWFAIGDQWHRLPEGIGDPQVR
jgi:hypothetical protein